MSPTCPSIEKKFTTDSSRKTSGSPVEGLYGNGLQVKKSLGLVGFIVDIVKYCLIGVLNVFVYLGNNWFLKHFGLALIPLSQVPPAGKRKFSEVEDTEKETNDDEKVESTIKMELKRWRPDHVYEAINDFVKMMWGESDMNENIKNPESNDENMNNFPIGHSVLSNWKQIPDINFVSQKVVGVKSVDEGVGHIRDLTPKKRIDTSTKLEENMLFRKCDGDGKEYNSADKLVKSTKQVLIDAGNVNIETSTPLIEDKAPDVFVFSAEKAANCPQVLDDIQEDEQSMLSQMTFAEKQVYFAKKIKDEEVAALKSRCVQKPE